VARLLRAPWPLALAGAGSGAGPVRKGAGVPGKAVATGVEYELGVLVQGATWPEGVVPWLREAYLPDRVFESVLGMDKAAFYALPEWKQLAKKREVGLF